MVDAALGSPSGPKPYKFIGFGDIYGPKPYKFIGLGDKSVVSVPLLSTEQRPRVGYERESVN